MMNEEQRRVQAALNRQLSHVEWTPADRQSVLRHMREEEKPVKKKMSWGLALALLIVLLAGIALAAETMGLFNMFRKEGALPNAASDVMSLNLTAETERVIYTLREAAFDGHGGFLLVEAAAKDPKTLPLGEIALPVDPAGGMIAGASWSFDGEEPMTIAEYAAQHGYTSFLSVSCDFGLDCSANDAIEGGVVKTVYHFAYEGDTVKLRLRCLDFPFLNEEQIDPARQGEALLEVELNASPALWERSAAIGLDCPDHGCRLDSIDMTGTAIATYYALHFTVTDLARYQENGIFCHAFEADGQPWENGAAHIGSCQDPEAAGDQLTWTGSLTAREAPPEALTLLPNETQKYVIELKKLNEN